MLGINMIKLMIKVKQFKMISMVSRSLTALLLFALLSPSDALPETECAGSDGDKNDGG